MSESKKLSAEEIRAMTRENGREANPEVVELPDELLDVVSGGEGAFAYTDKSGNIYAMVCNHHKTTDELFKQTFFYMMKCPFASDGATCCDDCKHISAWSTGAKIQ